MDDQLSGDIRLTDHEKPRKKKRSRDRDDAAEENRGHKRSKSDARLVDHPQEEIHIGDEAAQDDQSRKTKKKKKKEYRDQDAPPSASTDVASGHISGIEGKSAKKSKHREHKPTETGPDQFLFDGEDGDGSTNDASKKTKKKKKPKSSGDTTANQDEMVYRDTAAVEPSLAVVADVSGGIKEKVKKRTKSSTAHEAAEGDSGGKRKKHEKTQKNRLGVDGQVGSPVMDDDDAPLVVEEASLQAVEKKEHRKKKKKRERGAVVETNGLPGAEPDHGELEQKTTSPSKHRGIAIRSDTPARPDFPFFTQTVSLYLPLYPKGFDKPISSAIEQYFTPSLGHYSSMFGGVLLGFKNVAVGPPEKPDPENLPTDETPALLETIESYAVGYAYVTADLDLFVPRRGAWMEGKVILQSEGHLGVLCWDRFNASIEAKRLPRGWEFIDLAQQADGAKPPASSDGAFPPSHQPSDADGDADMGDLPIVEQMHGTGYWVDSAKRRVSGQLMFRIKNFEVGTAGDDYGYLSITGTMLSPDEEARAASEEMAAERRRNVRMSNSLLRREARRVPEFSVTRLGKEDQEEDSSQRQELYKGSRLGTPDD